MPLSEADLVLLALSQVFYATSVLLTLWIIDRGKREYVPHLATLIAIGLIGSFALNVVLVTQFGGGRLGPVLVIFGILLLWLVGIAATILPARRASRLSPALATRTV